MLPWPSYQRVDTEEAKALLCFLAGVRPALASLGFWSRDRAHNFRSLSREKRREKGWHSFIGGICEAQWFSCEWFFFRRGTRPFISLSTLSLSLACSSDWELPVFTQTHRQRQKSQPSPPSHHQMAVIHGCSLFWERARHAHIHLGREWTSFWTNRQESERDEAKIALDTHIKRNSETLKMHWISQKNSWKKIFDLNIESKEFDEFFFKKKRKKFCEQMEAESYRLLENFWIFSKIFCIFFKKIFWSNVSIVNFFHDFLNLSHNSNVYEALFTCTKPETVNELSPAKKRKG